MRANISISAKVKKMRKKENGEKQKQKETRVIKNKCKKSHFDDTLQRDSGNQLIPPLAVVVSRQKIDKMIR